MKNFFIAVIIFCLTILKANAQYVSHYSEGDGISKDTLTDVKTGNHFIVDKKRIFITAFDSTYKSVLWKTDPVKDNRIPEYRNSRPTLVLFKLVTYKEKDVIYIQYSNTQFGTLSIETGAFNWMGQD
ncbi:MAG: hypothetical protein ACXVBF_13040 [Flavisolibacter sp.]